MKRTTVLARIFGFKTTVWMDRAIGKTRTHKNTGQNTAGCWAPARPTWSVDDEEREELIRPPVGLGLVPARVERGHMVADGEAEVGHRHQDGQLVAGHQQPHQPSLQTSIIYISQYYIVKLVVSCECWHWPGTRRWRRRRERQWWGRTPGTRPARCNSRYCIIKLIRCI